MPDRWRGPDGRFRRTPKPVAPAPEPLPPLDLDDKPTLGERIWAVIFALGIIGVVGYVVLTVGR